MPRFIQLAEELRGELRFASPDQAGAEVKGVASARTACATDLVFAEDAAAFAEALASKAAGVIIAEKIAPPHDPGKPLLVLKHPRLAFARASRMLRDTRCQRSPGTPYLCRRLRRHRGRSETRG
jgi:UDP-3-O-[3-hydroxymyristoyl] glucosamine N-acyltransferase